MKSAYIADQYPNRPLTNSELWEYDDRDENWTKPLVGVDTAYGTLIVSFIHCIDNTVLYLVFDPKIEKWVVVKTRSKFDLASAGSGGVVDIVQRNYGGERVKSVDDGADDSDEHVDVDIGDVTTETVVGGIVDPENIQVFTQTIEGIVETLPQSPLSIDDCAKLSDMPGVSIIPHIGNASTDSEQSSINISTVENESELPRPIREILSIILIVENGIEESSQALVTPIIYTNRNWEPIDLLSFDPEEESPLSAFESTRTEESEVVDTIRGEHGHIVRLLNKIHAV